LPTIAKRLIRTVDIIDVYQEPQIMLDKFDVNLFAQLLQTSLVDLHCNGIIPALMKFCPGYPTSLAKSISFR
jgi:hypothetical protein